MSYVLQNSFVRNIMIIASVGVFFGAVTSSGMMEVARKGIFNPSMFVFQDVIFPVKK